MRRAYLGAFSAAALLAAFPPGRITDDVPVPKRAESRLTPDEQLSRQQRRKAERQARKKTRQNRE